MGAVAAPMVAERTADDETSLTLDWSRDAAWLALSALPALVHNPEPMCRAIRSPAAASLPQSPRRGFATTTSSR
jgi:hypothetical protein